MREGSLGAPTRHNIDWQNPEFYDWEKINDEMERVFDICHGCRRCFNLCDSFPLLFDLIDEAPSGELDTVDRTDYKKVADACTLCDMCFMVSCPYVPPHEFDLDFPHLMLRYRAAERQRGVKNRAVDQLTETDRNGKLASLAPGIANWASERGNKLTRPAMEKLAGVHRDAALPKFHGKTFTLRAKNEVPEVNKEAPAYGRKAVLYATCFVNYNNPKIGEAARAVLAKNGVETEVLYPGCCAGRALNFAIAGGVDLSLDMLAEGQPKLERSLGPGRSVSVVNAPAEQLPFRDGTFDAAMIAFGIRNVPDFPAGLRELRRVLRPGGRLCVLEFSTPPSKLFASLSHLYLFNVLPRLGGMITGRPAAYRYLTDSVAKFPGADEFLGEMERAGFDQVRYRRMTGGIVCVHTGSRPRTAIRDK